MDFSEQTLYALLRHFLSLPRPGITRNAVENSHSMSSAKAQLSAIAAQEVTH
jgi:hypothetical protein